MKIVNAFGQLLLSVAEKLKSWSEKIGNGVTGTEDTTSETLLQPDPSTKTKVWGIVDGPIEREEFDPYDEVGLDDDWNYMLVAKIEEDGKIGTVNLWFETYKEAMVMKSYFDTNIEPLELN